MTATALARVLLVTLLALGLALAPSPTSAQAAEDGPAPATAPVEPGVPAAESGAGPSSAPASSGPSLLELLMPLVERIADFLFTQVLVGLLQGLASGLHKVVGSVLGSNFNFVTQTPPAASYGSPTVQALVGVTRGVANAALALVVLVGAFNLILREHLGSPYHAAMELGPRLIVGALLVNTSGWWTQLAIDANNALCGAVGGASLPAWDRADTASQLVVDLIAVLVYLIAGLLLLLQQLMRLALVDVLLVVAPIGLACWVLPQTQGWARLWSSTFLSTVFTQFVQVLALKLGGSLMTDLAPMEAGAAIVSLLLGVAIMTLTLKVPDLMRGQIGDGLGFVRYYVYQRTAGALGGSAKDGASRGSASAGKGS